jgi:hypothetical protein
MHLLLQCICTIVHAAASCKGIHAAAVPHHLLAHLGLRARDGERTQPHLHTSAVKEARICEKQMSTT